MARHADEGIRVEGLKELQREIRRVQDKDLKKQLRGANKEAAEVVKDRAKPAAPSRSGRLQKSVGVKAGQKEASVKAGSPARVPYAGAIHFGWPARNIEPNRFLNEALRDTREKVRDTYEKSIEVLTKALSSK